MISKMKRLLLGARTSEREKVLEILRFSEIVHIEPAEPERVKVPGSINEDLDNCHKAISLLSQINKACSSEKLATPGTPTRLVEETLAHARGISEIREKILVLNRELEEVEPWGKLGVKDVAWLKAAGLHIAFYKGPLADSADIEAETVVLVVVEGKIGLFAAASRSDIRASENFVQMTLPEREVTQIRDSIQNCQHEIADHQLALECLVLRRDDVERHYKKLLNRKRYAEVESGLHGAEDIFVLTGWCPEDKIESLQKTFEDAAINVGMSFEDPVEGDTPPTKLDNSPWAESIAPLYSFMGLTPSYTEPDTSPLFLLTLTVFASFLIADAGYGLLVFLPIALAYKSLVRRGVDANFLKLAMFLYGGGAIYGALTNSWFGETFYLVDSNQFNPESRSGSLLLQGLCLFIGVLHLTLAHIMKISRRKIDLTTLGEVGWIFFLWGMYGMICKMIVGNGFVMPDEWAVPLFKISLLLIFLFTAPSLNLFKSVFAGFLSILMNASAAFSDILSYIRLWAVGLAGAKLAQAFNNIGAMLPSIMLFGLSLPLLKLPLWIIGHGGNMILGVIGILSHGVRLNLLEFSNHLELDWAGRKYDPFKEIK